MPETVLQLKQAVDKLRREIGDYQATLAARTWIFAAVLVFTVVGAVALAWTLHEVKIQQEDNREQTRETIMESCEQVKALERNLLSILGAFRMTRIPGYDDESQARRNAVIDQMIAGLPTEPCDVVVSRLDG